jgi:hypothetical protein
VPTVSVGSRHQADQGSISVSWSCPDTDVASYEYAVSTSADETHIVRGGEWANVGTATSAVRTKLALSCGDAVRVLVRAKNSAGVTSEMGVSPPVRIVQETANMAAAKMMEDGAWVHIPGLRLSRMGDGPECYVQDSSRILGMKIRGDWSGIRAPNLRQSGDCQPRAQCACSATPSLCRPWLPYRYEASG